MFRISSSNLLFDSLSDTTMRIARAINSSAFANPSIERVRFPLGVTEFGVIIPLCRINIASKHNTPRTKLSKAALDGNKEGIRVKNPEQRAERAGSAAELVPDDSMFSIIIIPPFSGGLPVDSVCDFDSILEMNTTECTRCARLSSGVIS